MNNAIGIVRRALVFGLAWAILWMTFWMVVVMVIGVVDPDSIDPGEGPLGATAILGPMGLFSGIVVGTLLTIAARGRKMMDLPISRVVACGILGSAIVQVPYLGHGDSGLTANIKLALLFAAFGGVVTIVWVVMARWWSHWRLPSEQSTA